MNVGGAMNFIYVVGISLFFFLNPLQAKQYNGDIQPDLKVLDQEIHQLKSQLKQKPGNLDVKTGLANRLKDRGRYRESLTLFREILKQKPGHQKALEGVTPILLCQLDLKALRKHLKSADSKAHWVKKIKAQMHQVTHQFPLAERLWREILKKEPKDEDALLGLGECFRAMGQTREAENKFKQVIALDPKRTKPLILLADMATTRRDLEAAHQYIQKALLVNPLNSDAHYALGWYLFLKERLEPSVKELYLAIRLNPWNQKARSLLGNGHNSKGYPDNLRRMETAGAIKYIEKKISQRAYPKAYRELYHLTKKYKNDPLIYTHLAAVALYENHLDRVIQYSFKALELDPHWGMAHYLISEAMEIKAFNINQISQAIHRSITLMDIKVPKGLREVFINYDSLPPHYQKLVCISVNPLKRFLPAMAKRGITHYIMPLYQWLYEAPRVPLTKGQRIPDGRLWDDVKGCGGLYAVTGYGTLNNWLYGDFNVLCHEFAHQVHLNAFTDAQRSQVRRLFERAKKEGRTLDYYAYKNQWEYFAQGVEAFISNVKLPNILDTSIHTSRELYQKDPELYMFIAGLDSE